MDGASKLEYEVWGGVRWYEAEAIHHPAVYRAGALLTSEWWECPECGSELRYNATHDESIDGVMLSAVPDVWRCDCGFNHAE